MEPLVARARNATSHSSEKGLFLVQPNLPSVGRVGAGTTALPKMSQLPCQRMMIGQGLETAIVESNLGSVAVPRIATSPLSRKVLFLVLATLVSTEMVQIRRPVVGEYERIKKPGVRQDSAAETNDANRLLKASELILDLEARACVISVVRIIVTLQKTKQQACRRTMICKVRRKKRQCSEVGKDCKACSTHELSDEDERCGFCQQRHDAGGAPHPHSRKTPAI